MYARRRALPTRPAVPAWKWALAVVLSLLLLGGGWRTLTLPRNPAAQHGAATRTVAQDWAELKAFGPRPVGTPDHDRALEWLSDQFGAMGYRVTRQPVTLTRTFDRGGRLSLPGLSVPVQALYGAVGGEQRGRLVRVPADATRERMEALGVRGQLALTTCGRVPWRELTDRMLAAGAFGAVIVDDCARRALQRVGDTALPLVKVGAADGQKVLARAGQPATLTSSVDLREVTGHNLIAARVEAAPQIVFGAHLDSVDASPGANDNASGVLAVLNVARRAAGTPLADRAWFVLFDAEEDGVYGSRVFAGDRAYPIRETRAMLNFDMVGVAAQPLGVATTGDLLPLARAVRPDLRVFEDEPLDSGETFGRTARLSGRSDHVNFKRWGVRTVFMHRGEDPAYHSPADTALDPALVQDAAAFALDLAGRVLSAPWSPREPCGLTGRDCRH